MDDYKFVEKSIQGFGTTCPNCDSSNTYLFTGGQHTEAAHFSRKCNACGEAYKVVYLPHHIEKLRKDF